MGVLGGGARHHHAQPAGGEREGETERERTNLCAKVFTGVQDFTQMVFLWGVLIGGFRESGHESLGTIL